MRTPDAVDSQDSRHHTSLRRGPTALVLLAVVALTSLGLLAEGQAPPPTASPAQTPVPTPTPTAVPPPAPAPTPPPVSTPTPTTPASGTMPADPGLSVVLVVDVSGSMNSNNKLADAKQAALESIGRYLTPDLGAQPALVANGGGTAPVRPPAMSLDEASRIERFRDLAGKLERLQTEASRVGADGVEGLLKWTKGDMERMRGLIDQMSEVMEGVVLEKKQPLLKQLNPLLEKMHFAIAKKVNHELGGGMRYMVSGKKSDHPDFGGLFADKMSDHDAIYVGSRASEAKRRHEELARAMLGEDWLRRTDSAMESGEATFRAARTTGARAADFRAFQVGANSNNDWMRTVSGGGWVSDYVVEKGEVIDLDALRSNPDEARRTLQQTLPELRAQGVSFDPRGPRSLGYNLGAVSDFDRQYMLNLHRRQAAGEAMDLASVLQKDKYFPRFEQMLEQTGTPLPAEFQQLKADIAAAKGGVTPDQARRLEERFSSFRNLVREQASDLQVRQYDDILRRAAEARNSNPQLAEALIGMADELADDTQGALHNYEQLQRSTNPVLGGSEATLATDNVVDRLRSQGGGGAALADRVERNVADELARFVGGEPDLARTVNMERVASFGTADAAEAAADATRMGGKTLIRTSQRWRDYIRANPGTTLLYVAGVGWTGYEVYAGLQADDPDRAFSAAAVFAGQEAATVGAEYVLASKFGYAAGSGGAVVAVAGISGMAGYWLSSQAIATADGRRATDILSGRTADNQPVAGQTQGFLEFMGESQPMGSLAPPPGSQVNLLAAPTPEEIARRYPEGQYKDVRIEVDPNTQAVTIRRRTQVMPMQYASTNPVLVDDWDKDKRTIPRNELLSQIQMERLYTHMRGKYRDALDAGSVAETGRFDTNYTYQDGLNSFTVPNPGGALSQREYTFYRQLFDDNWSRYTLGQQPWPEDELFRAKADMFKRMMQSVVDGKQQDMKLQQAFETMNVEELELMRDAAAAGKETYLNGRRLSLTDLEDRITLARSARDGSLAAAINRFNDSSVPPEFTQEIDVALGMGSLAQSATPGSVEFGLLTYSGGCSSQFGFHPFSRVYRPLYDAITGLTAGGGTPMTPALYQARWAIWTEGKAPRGTIILLTDGQNDCAENPVEAADKIYQRIDSAQPGQVPTTSWLLDLFAPSVRAAQLPAVHPIDMSGGVVPPGRRNIPITVSTVGFQVTDTQQQALDEIARVGGGQSVRAENMAQLAGAFQTAIATSLPAAPAGGGGGGGGPVVGFRGGSSWPVLALVSLLAASTGLVVALVAVKRRRSAQAPTAIAETAYMVDVVYGSGAHKRCPIAGGSALVGRDAGCAIILNDPEVSGRHAELVSTAHGLTVRDTGSRHGTFVNGTRVATAGLVPGDKITMGTTQLTVHRSTG